MSQPIIGITMSLDTTGTIRPNVDYSFIRREYGEQVRDAGGQPIFLDSTITPAVAARMCDGIIISGGKDIHPSQYHTRVSELAEEFEPTRRTNWERELIDACDWANVPILGVCYGSQLLNIHYGGTLYQDLATERPGTGNHGVSAHAAIQPVTFAVDFLGFKKGEAVPTAHRHHQAVHELAPGFTVSASAPDGTIEAISGRGHYGIQWHAESDDTAGVIYKTFIAGCHQAVRPHMLSDLLPGGARESI